MRLLPVVLALALTACDRQDPPPLPEAPQPASRSIWFICDAIDAPTLLVFEREGDTAHVAQYSKPDGAIVQRTEYEIAAPEAGAGSIYTTLRQNGAEAGSVRQINPGMLEEPTSAYTPPFTSVRIGEREIGCRWMPRTRVLGFTARRSLVVREDVGGDLIYTSYDFATAAEARPVELSENARTTTFSIEVRNGEERASPAGVQFRFQGDTETAITVTIGLDDAGALEIRRRGPTPSQTEQLIAVQSGEGLE